jgi:hypothetical protein
LPRASQGYYIKQSAFETFRAIGMQTTSAMNRKSSLAIVISVSFFLGYANRLNASLNLVGSGNVVGLNLVANGSFEIGSPSPGTANNAFWANPSSSPYSPIPGWSATGPSDNYAVWGSDEVIGPFHLRNSDIIPHGQSAAYFGNGEFRSVDLQPTFNPDYTVTFSGTPTFGGFNYTGPVILSQAVPTQLNPAPLYGLSFWVSGEGAQTSPATTPGIFGLRVLNTEAGDPFHYLVVPPGASSSFGQSHVFHFEFSPLNSSQPVTLEFYNFGHTGYNSPATEIVLDDVRVVTIPEPSALALLALGTVLSLRREFRAQKV